MPPIVPYDPTANPYPKVMYHKEYPANTKVDHMGIPHVVVKGQRIDVPEDFHPVVVNDAEEESDLGADWTDSPAVAETPKHTAAKRKAAKK